MDDERWIWPDIAATVRHLRPRYVVLENVAGHLVRGAARVVGDLAAAGYVGSWRCVRACDVGAPHRRERLFILAADAERVGRAGWGARGAAAADQQREGPRPPAERRGTAAADAYRDTVRTPAVTLAGRGSAAVIEDVGARALGLLPTPTARDGASGITYVSSGEGSPDLRTVAALLPTPTATNWHGNQTNNRGELLLPGAVQSERWGRYAAAVARWEDITLLPAPDPTDPGRNGQPRLSAQFVEWLMGLPAGWVTDHTGRNAALRILGNGVVPQQGAYALVLLTAGGAR
jgi:DNA (cytosine-5)-methyltransferase 1